MVLTLNCITSPEQISSQTFNAGNNRKGKFMALLFSLFLLGYKLKNFTIAAGNTFNQTDLQSFNPESCMPCVHEPGQLNDSEIRELRCDRPVVGRYVTVYLYQFNVTAKPLTICELEIFGETAPGNCVLFYMYCTVLYCLLNCLTI